MFVLDKNIQLVIEYYTISSSSSSSTVVVEVFILFLCSNKTVSVMVCLKSLKN